MSVIFTGTAKTQAVRSVVFDPRDGYRYVERKSGKPADIEADFAAAQAAGYRCRYDPDAGGGYASLEIEIGRDPAGSTEELSNEWYLLGNDLEKSLFEHPDIKALFASDATPEQVLTFRQDVEKVVRGDMTYAELAANFTPTVMQTVDKLLDHLAHGQETFFVSQFVLRNTIVLPANYSGVVDISHANEVYTTSQLFAAEQVAIPLVPALANLAGDWLKKTPTFEQMGRDKWRVDREWWHADEWSYFYARAT